MKVVFSKVLVRPAKIQISIVVFTLVMIQRVHVAVIIVDVLMDSHKLSVLNVTEQTDVKIVSYIPINHVLI
jgi:hypothetical protein